MPDETLDIAIKVRTDDLSKIKQTGQELKAVGQAAQEAAQKDAGASDEAAKKTGFLSLKKTELKKLVRELGHEFPLAGQAAKAMMDPVLAAFMGAIAIFGHAKQKLEEWNKALDEAAEKNAGKDFLPGIEAKSKSLHEAAVSSAEFHESLKNIGAAEDEFSAKVKLAIDKLHEFMAAQAEVRNASEASEIARINLAEKQGKMTGTQAIVARAGVKERYRKMGEEQQTAGENAELAMKEKELAHAKGQAGSLEADYATKKAAADKLRAAQAQATADMPVDTKRLEEAEKAKLAELDKAQAAREKAEAAKRASQGMGGNWGGSFETTREEETAAKEAEAKANAAVAAFDAAKKKVDQDKAAMDEIPIKGAPVFSAARMAEQRAMNNANRIEALGQETTTLREILPIRQGGRAEAGRIKSGTAAMEVQGELQDKFNAGRDKERQLSDHIDHSVTAGSPVDTKTIQSYQGQVEQNQQLGRVITAGNKMVGDAISKNSEVTAASYAELAKRLSSLENTRKLNPPMP